MKDNLGGIDVNIGNKILGLRRQKNVTQEELAANLGVTAAAVSKWENNYNLPDIYMLCSLADYFEVTTDELLGRAKDAGYAVIASETMELGKNVADIARMHGIVTRNICTDYDEARSIAKADGSIRYLIACYLDGFYGDCPDVENLVSVAPSEKEALDGIRRVFDKYLDN